MRGIMAVVVSMLAASCGGGGGGTPTTPTPTIPSVAGSYSGTATFTFPEIPATMTCPASTSVTQSGSTINVAPLILSGQCDNMSLPFGQAIIDATGAIQGDSRGTFNEPSCGTYTYSGSGGFFGREFRLSLAFSSSTCYNFTFTMVLTR